MQDEDVQSPWGGVILVALGVAMALFPIASLFTGVSLFTAPDGGAQDVTGIALMFFCAPFIFSIGVAELRKAPPQYRLRTLFVVTTVVAAIMAIFYMARNY